MGQYNPLNILFADQIISTVSDKDGSSDTVMMTRKSKQGTKTKPEIQGMLSRKHLLRLI